MRRVCLFFAGILASACVAAADSTTKPPPVEAQPEALVARYGRVVSSQPVGAGGLTAWTVEKQGRQVVLYTTADAEVLFTGVLWEAATGRNLSDQFVPAAVIAPPVLPGAVQAAAMDGDFTGELPVSIKTVDSLAGITEGTGGPGDTVYIIIDPRCPYCRAAYRNTRDYVKQGHTIKWIPTVALGNPAEGTPIAATLLQSTNAGVLSRVLGDHEPITTEPTEASMSALDDNVQFMFAAFEANGNRQAGVPVAFFLDHRTGQPRMMTGVSEALILQDIFGPLEGHAP